VSDLRLSENQTKVPVCSDDEHFKPCQLSHLSVHVLWIRFVL